MVSADKEEGGMGVEHYASSVFPEAPAPLSPQVATDCHRQGLIWPSECMLLLNNVAVGGGGAGGWGGGANEEGSAQPPEENLIVWGLPWVLLIKKKRISI